LFQTETYSPIPETIAPGPDTSPADEINLPVPSQSRPAPRVRLPLLPLAGLTAAAVAIHGYHLGVEDSEIYVPAAKKLLHPDLYPYATEFFLSHGRLSLFSPLLAWTARLTHLSMDSTIAFWYVVTLFLTLVACWQLAAVCFTSPRARWCSLLTMTAVLTMPATNTGLLLMDPYLTARSFSTPLTLIALVCFLQRRYILAGLTVLVTAAFHPQMAACLFLLTAILWIVRRSERTVRRPVPILAAGALILPPDFGLGPAPEPYREALYARDYFFLSNWTWYHWLGLLAPLAFLLWFSRGKLRGVTPAFTRLSFALIPFGLLSIFIAAIFSSTHALDMFARLQPMRCFHLVTLIFVLLLGGVLGEYAARNRRWVIPAVSVPLALGMFFVARATYPDSPHIELPWLQSSPNAWIETLLWVRHNTPRDAVFAVDSHYFKDHGVDVHGFRAISERSELADYYKDGGVAAMFPRLAVEWKQMSSATDGLNRFTAHDFEGLARQYPVSWAVIHGPAPAAMDCPYQQRGYAVCRIPTPASESPAMRSPVGSGPDLPALRRQ
jgi:hypothetical protein